VHSDHFLDEVRLDRQVEAVRGRGDLERFAVRA